VSPGPLPYKAIDIAMPVALARGFVILCRHYYGFVCDLVIAEPGQTTIVRICRTKRLYDTVAGMAVQFPAGIAGLARVPKDPGRSLEIWAVDYYGNLRFFRVVSTGLVEIDRHGSLIDTEAEAAGAMNESPPRVIPQVPSQPDGAAGVPSPDGDGPSLFGGAGVPD